MEKQILVVLSSECIEGELWFFCACEDWAGETIAVGWRSREQVLNFPGEIRWEN